MIAKIIPNDEPVTQVFNLNKIGHESIVGIEGCAGSRGFIVQDDANQGWFRARCANIGLCRGSQWSNLKGNTITKCINKAWHNGFTCYVFETVPELLLWLARHECEDEDSI